MRVFTTRSILTLSVGLAVLIAVGSVLAAIYLRRPLFCNYFATFPPHWVQNAPVTNPAHDLLLYDTSMNLFVYVKGDDPSQPSASCTQFYWPSLREVTLTAWNRKYTIHPASNQLVIIRPSTPERIIPVSSVDARTIKRQISDAISDFSASVPLFDTLNRIAP